MRPPSFLAIAVCAALASPVQPQSAVKTPRRYIARCTYDSQNFSLLDAPHSLSLQPLNDVHIRARMLANRETGAVFTLSRAGHPVGRIVLADLYNPNGWITPSPNWKRFAISWSDGGGAGDWETRLFHFSPTGRLVEDRKALQAIQKDFSPRFHCQSGNSFDAVHWADDDHLIMEAFVYPSSACGSEMGHTEGYLLNASSDTVQAHYTEFQLINLPAVCTVNASADSQEPPLIN